MEYQIMFYGGLAGALITLVIAILVYVKLNIAQVMTDLTGRNFPGAARKARKKSSNETTATLKPVTKEINVRKNVDKDVAAAEAVEPTEKMLSGSVAPTALLNEEGLAPTALLSREGLDETALLSKDSLNPTALLSQEGNEQTASPARREASAATALLSPGRTDPVLSVNTATETTILSDWGETTVLTADPDETTLLDDFDETTLLTEEDTGFKKQVDIMIIHSNTII